MSQTLCQATQAVASLSMLFFVGSGLGCSNTQQHDEPEVRLDNHQQEVPLPQTTPVPLTELTARLAKYACEFDFECPASALGLRVRFRDLSACQTEVAREEARWPDTSDLVKASEAGTLVYDPSAAGRCFTVDCSIDRLGSGLRASRVCPEAFGGALTEGDVCWRSEECAGDAYCDHGVGLGGGFQAACPGVCRARVPIGGSCAYGLRCVDPPGRDKGACRDDVCTQYSPSLRATEGAACGEISGQDGVVVDYVSCGEGLWCSSGSCRRGPLPPDSPCSRDDDRCSGSQVCDIDEGRCREVKLALENEPCGESVSEGTCAGFALECVAGRCQRPGDGSLGAHCIEDVLTTCDDGLECDFSEICLPLKQVGEACAYNQDCESGECNGRCDGGDCIGRCLPRICRT